jgi:hypothetical protein
MPEYIFIIVPPAESMFMKNVGINMKRLPIRMKNDE